MKNQFMLFLALVALLASPFRALAAVSDEKASETVTSTAVTVPGSSTVSVAVTVTPEPAFVPASDEAAPATAPASKVMAVAFPTCSGKINAAQAQAFWSLIESAVPEGEYRVATRAGMTQLCAEMGVPAESLGRYDFSKATPEVKQALARHREVGLLLVTDISSVDDVSRTPASYTTQEREVTTSAESQSVDSQRQSGAFSGRADGTHSLNVAEKGTRTHEPIPESGIYTVVANDSLGKIAYRYGISVADIRTWNGLTSKDTLKVGQKLKLRPDEEEKPAAEPATATNATSGKLRANENLHLEGEANWEGTGKKRSGSLSSQTTRVRETAESGVVKDNGSTYMCTVRLVDLETGLVVPGRKGNFTAATLQELTDKLEHYVARILAANKSLPSALLLPNVRVPNGPVYLGEYSNTVLENQLLQNGVRLQNLLSVKEILRKEGLDGLSELPPAMFVKVGKLLEVKTLMQLCINRFEVTSRPFEVKETGAKGVRVTGSIGGYLRIVSAQTGELVSTIPFEQKFGPLRPSGQFLGWEQEDFGKYFLSKVICETLMPQLMSIRDQL